LTVSERHIEKNKVLLVGIIWYYTGSVGFLSW